MHSPYALHCPCAPQALPVPALALPVSSSAKLYARLCALGGSALRSSQPLFLKVYFLSVSSRASFTCTEYAPFRHDRARALCCRRSPQAYVALCSSARSQDPRGLPSAVLKQWIPSSWTALGARHSSGRSALDARSPLALCTHSLSVRTGSLYALALCMSFHCPCTPQAPELLRKPDLERWGCGIRPGQRLWRRVHHVVCCGSRWALGTLARHLIGSRCPRLLACGLGALNMCQLSTCVSSLSSQLSQLSALGSHSSQLS